MPSSTVDEELRFSSMAMWTGVSIRDVAIFDARAAAAEEMSRNIVINHDKDNEFIEHWSSCLGLENANRNHSQLGKGVEVFLPDKMFQKLHNKTKSNFNLSYRGVSVPTVAPIQEFGLALISSVRESQPVDTWRWCYGGASWITLEFGIIRIIREEGDMTVDDIRAKLSSYCDFISLMQFCENAMSAGDEASHGSLSAFKSDDLRDYSYLRPSINGVDKVLFRANLLGKGREVCPVLMKLLKKHLTLPRSEMGAVTFVDLRSFLLGRPSPDIIADLVSFVSFVLLSHCGRSEINILLPIEILSNHSTDPGPPAFHSRSQGALMSAVCVPTVRPLTQFHTKLTPGWMPQLRGALVMWHLADATESDLIGCKPLVEARAKMPSGTGRLRRQAASLDPSS